MKSPVCLLGQGSRDDPARRAGLAGCKLSDRNQIVSDPASKSNSKLRGHYTLQLLLSGIVGQVGADLPRESVQQLGLGVVWRDERLNGESPGPGGPGLQSDSKPLITSSLERTAARDSDRRHFAASISIGRGDAVPNTFAAVARSPVAQGHRVFCGEPAAFCPTRRRRRSKTRLDAGPLNV